MRSEYHLKNGRSNPYVARLGATGRTELLEWWSKAGTKRTPGTKRSRTALIAKR